MTNLFFSSDALIPDEIARIREIFLSVRSPLGWATKSCYAKGLLRKSAE